MENFQYILNKNSNKANDVKHNMTLEAPIQSISLVKNVQSTNFSAVKQAKKTSEPIKVPRATIDSVDEKIEAMCCKIEKSESGKFKCPKCPYRLAKSIKDLKSHLRNHFPRENSIKCRFCDYYLLSIHNVATHEKLHTRLVEESESNISDIINTSKNVIFECDLCPYTSRTLDSLQKHKKNHEFRLGKLFAISLKN